MKNVPSQLTSPEKKLGRDNQKPPAEAKSDAAKRAAVREGIKAVDEGRTVSHGEVKTWLDSWGTDEELPPPECK